MVSKVQELIPQTPSALSPEHCLILYSPTHQKPQIKSALVLTILVKGLIFLFYSYFKTTIECFICIHLKTCVNEKIHEQLRIKPMHKFPTIF